MSRLYLCYRDQDSPIANVIIDRWRVRHGQHSVVNDALYDKPDEISLGMHIETKMLHVDAVWILIGRQWSGIDEYGRYRLSTADIPIFQEISQALKLNLPIAVLLVNGIEGLPPPEEVPEELQGIYDLPLYVIDSPQALDRLISPPTLWQRFKYLLFENNVFTTSRRRWL
ncbi:MAG: hypothetical protein CL607_08855 [Anaerolineaceae bacterium]|nr:hypothetical protein [Anaerolineaceae bacterium]